ncbi:sugar phosphate nucleotidyltransferase [Heyndrickxia coagulans]|uniref:sugar phosphate nucleotidyltransferase n=1 Tax=Heyndrickxia coagulans TaxID=1398 RepID=UPI002E24D46C|nr:sugar phosphate nucleotidyltransferase [Heyndrickxia coagulans]MED4941225.1 sugar phosphate nucleotidyltransferase [Heyndrickxia coagulans]
MKLVLLSGGSGKRLWPLSNDARSKQFLKVLESDNKGLQSMVQRVWNQLKENNLSNSTVIATSKSQVEIIQDQLKNEASLIIEPFRRDTFPAISLAASYLYTFGNTKLDEVIAVLPVDPYVDSSFFNKVKDLEEAIYRSDTDIALMGVRPTFPSEKYGYIVPKKDTLDFSKIYKVKSFKEKPTKECAQDLINNGAFWNCGVFAFRLGYLINFLKREGYPIKYDDLLKDYVDLPKISFDYKVLEKAKNIIVLPYDGYWKDLGTWNTLTEEMQSNQIGNGILKDSENTHLINELDIPVTILGVSNAIVAVSPDGILVSDKDKSPRIKEIVSEFDTRPMYEERLWGWYRVLDYKKYDSKEVLTKRLMLRAEAHLSYQYHLSRTETWTIISGKGIVILNDKIINVEAGDVIKISLGDKHAIKAITNLELIEVQVGIEIIEEDIVRINDNWSEIMELIYN